jgi:hypothetical protein
MLNFFKDLWYGPLIRQRVDVKTAIAHISMNNSDDRHTITREGYMDVLLGTTCIVSGIYLLETYLNGDRPLLKTDEGFTFQFATLRKSKSQKAQNILTWSIENDILKKS